MSSLKEFLGPPTSLSDALALFAIGAAVVCAAPLLLLLVIALI